MINLLKILLLAAGLIAGLAWTAASIAAQIRYDYREPIAARERERERKRLDEINNRPRPEF